jgi:Cu+-exporting ATPase
MLTTNGIPRVVSIIALDGLNDAALLALAASVASALEAPLGNAILESARERDIRARPVVGRTVIVGNAALFSDLQLSIESLGDGPERLRQHAQYVLFVAVDGRTVGFFGLAHTNHGG